MTSLTHPFSSGCGRETNDVLCVALLQFQGPLRVVGTNNRADQKPVCKNLYNLGNFDDPNPLIGLGASGAPAFTLQQGGWIRVHKRRFFLKERLGAVYITL